MGFIFYLFIFRRGREYRTCLSSNSSSKNEFKWCNDVINSGQARASHSHIRICIHFSVTPSVVSNVSKQFQNTGTIEGKPVQCRLRAIVQRWSLFVFYAVCRRNMDATASQPSRDLYAVTGRRVLRLLSRRLRERESTICKNCRLLPTHFCVQEESV